MRFGPKGRFGQPRAKPWDYGAVSGTALKGPLIAAPCEPAFQAGNEPVSRIPGLWPGLTETAFQAGWIRPHPAAFPNRIGPCA